MVNRYQQNSILDQAHKPHRLKKQEVVNRMRRNEEAKMEGKLRVIIKRPDEQFGHVTNISPTLENLQKTVGGPLEHVTLQKTNVTESQVILLNEEGKLKGLPRNFVIGYDGFMLDAIHGTVIVAQFNKEGEQVDLDMKFSTWKQLLADWGI
jgi:hypothetical protein